MIQMTAMTDVKFEAQSQYLRAYRPEIMATKWVQTARMNTTDAEYSHRANSLNATLICYENHKSRDDHAAGMRLYPSEIGLQSYQLVKNEETPAAQKPLRAVLQHFVIELETHMVLY